MNNTELIERLVELERSMVEKRDADIKAFEEKQKRELAEENHKTTKEWRTMLIKLIYKILKKLIDNCDKFYLEETDPDVIEAKELLGRVEKAMKAKGDDANAHQ